MQINVDSKSEVKTYDFSPVVVVYHVKQRIRLSNLIHSADVLKAKTERQLRKTHDNCISYYFDFAVLYLRLYNIRLLACRLLFVTELTAKRCRILHFCLEYCKTPH